MFFRYAFPVPAVSVSEVLYEMKPLTNVCYRKTVHKYLHNLQSVLKYIFISTSYQTNEFVEHVSNGNISDRIYFNIYKKSCGAIRKLLVINITTLSVKTTAFLSFTNCLRIDYLEFYLVEQFCIRFQLRKQNRFRFYIETRMWLNRSDENIYNFNAFLYHFFESVNWIQSTFHK